MIRTAGAIAVVVILIAVYSAAYRLTEGQQSLVTQFGRIIGEPVTNAGLHFKVPLVQEVRYFDKRILEWDGDPNQIPTKDKKYIWVDTTARWKIENLVKFAQTVRTETGAQARLDSILDGATRDVISKHNLVEAVRNSNGILAAIDRREEAKKKAEAELKRQQEDGLQAGERFEEIIEEEVTGEIEPVEIGREKLSEMILERARTNLENLGIQLIDVQIRRIAYEKSVEAKVYDRMNSERNRIAEKIRYIGKGEMAKIQGKLNKDLKEIESSAYRTSQGIRGKGEAEAIAIYAASLGKDTDFFRFKRSLEAYRKTFGKKSRLILSTDSEFLRYLK